MLDSTTLRITRREMNSFFTSPIGYLFLATFAAVCLFVFFWVESFFARNIIDVRPLFEWMPILLIFLCAALSMRMWSEERKSGTLEQVMTLPQPLVRFVLGKYFACMGLLLLALTLTLPLVFSVAMIGSLDWGPVWSGYLATFLLGSAYLSIGLFVSARNDNQIVSLIITTLICAFFYLLGSPVITSLFDNTGISFLSALGTGSRFNSITRGVIDFRDLYYYVSVSVVFLVLNTYSLEKSRQSAVRTIREKQWHWLIVLLIVNVLMANIWLTKVQKARVDTTAGKFYSLSSSTQLYLDQLQEPLLIRAYVSSKTHPLLAPLLPQLKDLLAEYALAGKGKVRFEWVDPAKNTDLEEEANTKYGIKPVPFQVNDKYQASLVNSYFDVLIQYGNEHTILGFKELIEIKSTSETDIDVQLRNPEYDITRAIKKVLFGFQSGGNLFAQVNQPLTFTGFISADSKLPAQLVSFKKEVQSALQEYAAQANGRLKIEMQDPDANGGQLAQKLNQEFGFRPMATSIVDSDTFYFYMVLTGKDQTVLIPIPESLDAAGFTRSFESGVKRFAEGFLKTVALVSPESNPMMAQFGMPMGKQFSLLENMLTESFNVKNVQLDEGKVPEDADILLLVAPQNLSIKQLFAVDQFLMQGGSVIVSTAPFTAQMGQTGLTLKNYHSGLLNWLGHHGVDIGKQLVLDTQNVAFPLPVTRDVNGVNFQELHMLDYPYFVDVRNQGLNQDNPITSGLIQVNMPWASPIHLNEDAEHKTITKLMQSSENAWLSDNLDVLPKYGPGESYEPEGPQAKRLLAVALQGKFNSYFNQAPDLAITPNQDEAQPQAQPVDPVVSSVISQSAASARLIVFSSNEFLDDNILQLSGVATGTDYINPLQGIVNAIEWSLEDSGLLNIRARSHFNRTLPPLSKETQLSIEYGNYVFAFVAVLFIAFCNRTLRRQKNAHYAQWLQGVKA